MVWGKFNLLILVLFLAPTLLAQDIDHLSLAKLLIKDGHYSRAEVTLSKLSHEEVSDRGLFSSLKGMIALHHQNYKEAIDFFHESQKQGLKDPEIFLYLAESWLQLGNFKMAEAILAKLPKEDSARLPVFLIGAELLWKQNQKSQAWSVLKEAEGLGLSPSVINKKKFSYLVEEGLYQAATALSFEMLKVGEAFNDVLAMASQLRLKQEHLLSLKILQALRVLRPENEVVVLEMAQNYLARGETYSAALVLEEAARLIPTLSFEASELLRQVDKSYRARFLNMTTADPAKQLKQKLALHLEEDNYLSLNLMVPQLNQHNLLEDQQIRYAVAYSLFRVGRFKQSINHLGKIDQEDLFEKSIELKKEIERCQQEKWACHETI